MSLSALPTLLLVPPLNLFAAACIGAVAHRHRLGRALLGIGLGGMLILSLPIVSGTLLCALETGLPTSPPPQAPPGAIVILSGDANDIQSGPGQVSEQVGALTLARELAGAILARRTGLPVLVTGGQTYTGSLTLGDLMARSLPAAFGIQPKWAETRSADTWQNAAMSAAILKPAGISSIFLVTSAWHMRRALIAFRAAGLTVTAAPTPLDAPPRFAFHNFLPHVSAWQESYYAMHEWIGGAWYRLVAWR